MWSTCIESKRCFEWLITRLEGTLVVLSIQVRVSSVGSNIAVLLSGNGNDISEVCVCVIMPRSFSVVNELGAEAQKSR